MVEKKSEHGGHSHGGHSHGGHSHGGHSHGSHPGHGVSVEEGFVPAQAPAQIAKPLQRGAGKGKVLYLDCPSGIAGDMTISALIDLGVPRGVFDGVIDALGLEGVELKVETGYAGAIGCHHIDVVVTKQHPERSYADIVELLAASTLEPAVRALAERIFERLAHAEAEVHRATLADVHFHEVGAVDALVDIVGAAAGFCFLGAEVEASSVPLGRGFVKCRHGVLPLPAPAALLALKDVPTRPSHLEVELVTPTGAAILATVASSFHEWPRLVVESVGWGAGTRGLPDRPNALRAVFGRPTTLASASTQEQAVLLEANLDDATGELGAYVVQRLLDAGALDAWLAPVTMKKGRAGVVLSVLAPLADGPELSRLILAETPSIGVRQTLVKREILQRRVETVMTPHGEVAFKVSGTPGEADFTEKPEFEACAEIARRTGLPLRQVLSEVMAARALQSADAEA